MKALTICQPYAELIACGEKRVENRTWRTSYRGKLAIHAGKSRQWLNLRKDDHGNEIDREYGIFVCTMDFGAVVAVADLIECLPADCILDGMYDERFPWLRSHEHVNGPWCWVLNNVKRLEPGIRCNGAQGLWEWGSPAAVSTESKR